MNLFEILPEKFFSILNGKNKNIYAGCLILLYTLINDNDLNVKRDEFVRFLKEKGIHEIELFSLEDEEDSDSEFTSFSVASKASFIVKHLEETGWLELELNPETFDEYIVLPTYSIRMIKTLFDITNESNEEYSSLVHSTYSELLLEDTSKDEFMYAVLCRAYENTKKLRVDLITLSHSIRIYQNRLNKIFTSNEILHSYFDNYKELVSDRLYHPIKTFDSVTRFRRPIINILNSWIKDSEKKNLLIKQGLVFSSGDINPKDVEKTIIEKVNFICDTFDTLNGMIDDIDHRHRDYTKSSANKILYLNNTDKSVKGNLENILSSIAKNAHNTRNLRSILSLMQDSISIYENGFINSESVSLPILRKYIGDQMPLSIVDPNFAGDIMIENFLSQLSGLYTDDRIYEFMQNVFGNEDEIFIEEIPLPTYEAFILLILATIKKDDPNCFYIVNYDSKEKVKNDGYILPKLIFKRKGA
ncbi:MAG: DUF5716 family protein [Bacilli bacterium]